MTAATATFGTTTLEDVARITEMMSLSQLYDGVKRAITGGIGIAKEALVTVLEKARARFCVEGDVSPKDGALIESSGTENVLPVLFNTGQLVTGINDKGVITDQLVDNPKSTPTRGVGTVFKNIINRIPRV